MHFCYKLRVYLWKKSGTRLGNVSGLIKGLMLAFPVLHMVWKRRPQSSPGILGEPRPAGSIQTAFPTTTTTAAPDRQTDKRAHVLDWRTWPRPLLAEDSGCQPADNKLIISSWIIILWLTGCKQLLHDAPDAEAPCERFHLEEIKQRSAPGTIAPVLWIYFSWCF